MSARGQRAGLAAALLLAFTLLLAPAAAHAGAVLDGAVAALRSDPVYVAPGAEMKISSADARALRDRIATERAAPMYVAILPAAAAREAGGTPEGVVRALERGVGRRGTYAVVVGAQFRASSDALPSRDVAAAATTALREHRSQGVTAVLEDFIARVGRLRRGDAGSSDGSPSGGGSGSVLTILLLGGLVVGGGALVMRRRRRRREDEAEFGEARTRARDELVALGDEIRALDLDMSLGAPQDARDAYARAVAAYDKADTAWERARTPEELAPVGSALEEGRYEMAVTRARQAGRPAPERRPPCFFDPRHGPSARDVEWAPPGGAPRPVPACEMDAGRVERGEEPAVREVMYGGRPVPYWGAGPAYAPFAGGFFGGGGLLPGLLAGSLIGGMWGGWGAGEAWGADPGDAGGGDVGGGDFGGGDFGGGDFGGGDFGGGDF